MATYNKSQSKNNLDTTIYELGFSLKKSLGTQGKLLRIATGTSHFHSTTDTLHREDNISQVNFAEFVTRS